jgi:hypothetical protein
MSGRRNAERLGHRDPFDLGIADRVGDLALIFAKPGRISPESRVAEQTATGGAALAAGSEDEPGLDIRRCTRAHLSAAL